MYFRLQASNQRGGHVEVRNTSLQPRMSSLQAGQQSGEILLVDEVDVFFGSDFYGQTHNQVAVLESAEAEDLLREVWQNRDEVDNLGGLIQKVLQCPQYQAMLQKYPEFRDVVKSEAVQMCGDLRAHIKDEKDYIFDGRRIGYKIMDGVAFDVVKGYKTAFAYLQEATKGQLQDETILKKALALRIPCGRFSYARFDSPKILGVSGTIQALGSCEWNVMQRFGIKRYTLVPSVYGKNNFRFLNQSGTPPITISTDESHFFDIATQAVATLKSQVQINSASATLTGEQDGARGSCMHRAVPRRAAPERVHEVSILRQDLQQASRLIYCKLTRHREILSHAS